MCLQISLDSTGNTACVGEDAAHGTGHFQNSIRLPLIKIRLTKHDTARGVETLSQESLRVYEKYHWRLEEQAIAILLLIALPDFAESPIRRERWGVSSK